MGRRQTAQSDMFLAAKRGDGSRFYEALNKLLADDGFDLKVEGLCEPYYSSKSQPGRQSVAPGVFFRMLLVGYFEGIGSERGICWRCADSISLRDFLGIPLHKSVPTHSTISRTRRRLPDSVFEEFFVFVLGIVEKRGLFTGEVQGIDSTFLKADASMKSIVRKDTEETYQDYIKRMAAEDGVGQDVMQPKADPDDKANPVSNEGPDDKGDTAPNMAEPIDEKNEASDEEPVDEKNPVRHEEPNSGGDTAAPNKAEPIDEKNEASDEEPVDEKNPVSHEELSNGGDTMPNNAESVDEKNEASDEVPDGTAQANAQPDAATTKKVSAEDAIRHDRKRKKKTSNKDFKSPTDPDSRITRMKNGTTRLAYKAEHVVDMETGVILGIEIYKGDEHDAATIMDSLSSAQENIDAVRPDWIDRNDDVIEEWHRDKIEIAADKGYHKAATLAELKENDYRTFIPERKQKGKRKFVDKGGEKTAKAFHQNRARMKRPKGKALQRKRSEMVERPNQHLYDRGGLRELTVTGQSEVRKRVLAQAASFNLGYAIRVLLGAGAPKWLAAKAAALFALIFAFATQMIGGGPWTPAVCGGRQQCWPPPLSGRS